MSKKLLILIFIYLLPLCLLTYLLAHSFTPKKPNAYTKIAQGQPISILVVGDSIGEGTGASRTSRNFPNRLKSILQQNYSVTATIVNVSMSGNTTYAPLIRTFKLPQEENFDLVIICSGENDPSTSYLAKHYEALVRNIKTKWPNAELISILESSQKKYTKKIETIQKIAKHYNISTADTITPFTNGENGEYKSLTADKLHPNDKGYEVYAKTLESVIITNIHNRTNQKQKIPSPLFAESLNYANLIEIPTNVLTRNDNTFAGQINIPQSAQIGIEIDYIKGSNSYELIVNNKSVSHKQFNWKYSSKHFITELSKIDATGECQVSITFGTQEQADSFSSFFISYTNPEN